MMNDLPAVFEEVLNLTAETNQTEKSTVLNHSSTKSESNSMPLPPPTEEEEEGLDYEEDEDDGECAGIYFTFSRVKGETLCGLCGENYYSDEFWIGCDICEKWFHGKCVNITPAMAEKMEQYECPSCCNNRSRL